MRFPRLEAVALGEGSADLLLADAREDEGVGARRLDYFDSRLDAGSGHDQVIRPDAVVDRLARHSPGASRR